MGFLICDQNFLDTDVASAISYSSQNSSFPASNLNAFQRRGKVWRSTGNFTVTSTNKTIIFRDDITTDKTATIAEGNYATIALFMTAVDTALEATGAANYTVTQNVSTGKFVITSDLSGGATAFQLRWLDVLCTAYDILGFSNAAHDTGATTYTSDSLRIHTDEWIKVDLGISSNLKAVVLIGKRNEPIHLSTDAVIKIQGNSTDVWTAPEYTTTLSYHEESIYKAVVAGLHTQALRYWRVQIIDRENPLLYIELSNVYFGSVWDVDRASEQWGFEDEQIDLSVNVETESGVILSDIRPQRQAFAYELNFLTKTDAESLKNIFADFGTAKQFFIIMDNEQAFSTQKQKWCKYVKFFQSPKISLDSPNNFSTKMALREEL